MAKIQTLRVSCPYCQVGHCEVIGTEVNGEVKFTNMHTPRKCVTCNQYIVLKPKAEIIGITMEQASKEARNVR